MKKKKILFIYRTRRKEIFDNWQQKKGADTLLYSANHLKNLGYSVSFFDYPYNIYNILHPLFYPLEHGIMKSVGMGFKIDQALALLPIMNNYDLIITTGDSSGLPILALKKYGLLKKPVIYITAGLAGALRNKKYSLLYNFYKQILSQADISIAYSQVEIDFFEKFMGMEKGSMKFVPLGVDYDYFSQKSSLKKNIICAVGLDSCRDYKTFFEAIKHVSVQVEVVCYPNNIKNLRIPSNVKINSFISISEVRRIYQRSIISIIPSNETFRSTGQIVFLESASAQVPVVATKILGLTTAFKLKNNTHLLYSAPQDPQDLKEKINFLLNNPRKGRIIAANASNLVKNNYTTKYLAKNLAGIIEKL